MDRGHKFPDGELEANFITLSLLGEKLNRSITTFPPHSRKTAEVSTSFFSAVILRTYTNFSWKKFNN